MTSASGRERASNRPNVDVDTLNLGCGRDFREDAWNVDVSPDVDADEHVNLQETPWHWGDNAFERILAFHVLEHLDPVPWGELERVLAPGGELHIEYPIGHTRFEDGSHKQFWNVNTAGWIAGDRKHPHEAPLPDCNLIHMDVEWHVNDSAIWNVYTRLRIASSGVGAWLSQIPGLYGHVTAVYRHQGGGDA